MGTRLVARPPGNSYETRSVRVELLKSFLPVVRITHLQSWEGKPGEGGQVPPG